jgi:hypothetical protein
MSRKTGTTFRPQGIELRVVHIDCVVGRTKLWKSVMSIEDFGLFHSDLGVSVGYPTQWVSYSFSETGSNNCDKNKLTYKIQYDLLLVFTTS